MHKDYYLQKVTAVEVLEDYRVRVMFADGFSCSVDLRPLLGCGPIFEPLRDPDFFRKVGVSKIWGVLEWPGEIDLSPGSLRAWCEAGRFMNHDETDAWIESHRAEVRQVA
jgi:hypothetical protein